MQHVEKQPGAYVTDLSFVAVTLADRSRICTIMHSPGTREDRPRSLLSLASFALERSLRYTQDDEHRRVACSSRTGRIHTVHTAARRTHPRSRAA
eukprot:scaffold96101_cov105-Phaeocystis_antarctica.AAC.2